MSRPIDITFKLDAFSGGRAFDRTDLGHRALMILLDALFLIDLNFLKKYPQTPSIYNVPPRMDGRPGLLYKYPVPGIEDWQDIPTTLERGTGDCKVFAPWRAAELVLRHGVRARPVIDWRPRKDGGYLYHVRVAVDGRGIEDPSRVLGMGTVVAPPSYIRTVGRVA